LKATELVAGTQDEVQAVSIYSPVEGMEGSISGTFFLSFGGFETWPLAWDSSELQVEAALEALPDIGPAGVTVIFATLFHFFSLGTIWSSPQYFFTSSFFKSLGRHFIDQ